MADRDAGTPAPVRPRLRTVLPAALASVAPVLVYFLVRPFVPGDAVALAAGAAVPAGLTLATAAIRRRLAPLAALGLVGLGVALAATLMSGGSSLPLKLYRPLTTGAVGLALLASGAARRPALVPLLERLGDLTPAGRPDAPRYRRVLAVLTAVVGAALVVEAGVTVLLALWLDTGTYLIASRVAKVPIAVAGVLVAAWLARRTGGRRGEPAPGVPRARRAWFAPKRSGIGWRPQTWQGWLIVCCIPVVVIAIQVGVAVLR